ncbi:similar to Saccharomyces cerevisiae YGL143C MRF1 Mitochondrial translation release factor [Maudiozyma barnettii]|uniref:Peptide chain release factor 1, mitochondrial n=1 Tax=Maudiozyma barnettii TaxID=61262 RepID=A0A8H2ZHH4_9SACH|nr:Mrf1p [Kazachstania barnettii]CAB4254507.1 similar to Saccharomyces cerevisiae YGL143C MRF1 Mitochondrial translation release factor [Kazachstania barnettii]CAD1782525.1 similar to Saccharomyces cerevisiae YGL143C MRF1 Mitochondrial translation release factor [Kazachstania barnettii]
MSLSLSGIKWFTRKPVLLRVIPRHSRRFQSQLSDETILNETLQRKELPASLIKKAQLYGKEFLDLEQKLSKGENFNVDDQKRFAKCSSIAETLKVYQNSLLELNELNEMIKMDPSLKEEAEMEINTKIPKFNETSNNLLSKLIPTNPFADKPCIMELRPGVGGIEAMIFAQDLASMYLNYASTHHWKHHIISQQMNESGSGILSSVLSIDQPGSYERLRLEAGVHRVQRIPATETKGRTHTSTAAVVVLPQLADDSEKSTDAYERTFKPDEIRVDVKRASGKGGQHVNTTDSAVRLTHFPSGIVISMQDERSQHKNKAKAFTLLRAKLAEKEQREKEAAGIAARKEQVTTTDRSDKIRTYNYPQNRITDHRCGFAIHDIPGVMAGDKLDEIIDATRIYETDEKAKTLLVD